MLVLLSGSLLSVVVLLASKNGSKAAQLEALKAEIKKRAKEQEHAQKIRDRVFSMDEYRVRSRLHDITNK